ncbi:glycosyltransferase family 2 protein [Streptomyces sp. WAC05374]|uniref:glycosyltransferase family 2 protein n=1 Tax=Streptomyces sp. WAC05374 TaxID=2487420 RepID=UPI000F87373C|nr:glycosyltransferase [Streptomyces sp. WAC05374]RST16725.1 glycosyltransferase family 2 protein [Streptomyces sp. WAC05374]TDF45360.1 glycosyltransferase family 2 protein [Streptomyces sp. WAC05374]TDF55652.1 glycosyltransferase family 2 protein [Streptomyces sp. WAC05374]TDF58789.1 glycosyltransferase family 2 protein [Streptomyces sp. WAC05374]
MTTPDVTVVVAVYNTMPYLTECLNSLVGQSIGLDRLEVVAVDDGSTDDSGRELDRFAEKYPNTVKVIHQANSGGPAAPSNRALELATGRYVYFIGSDDYLGKEALARMVACADEHGSDVVVGKMVGTNGRYVHQALFKKSDPDVSLYDSALPFTLANTKLFRRELVEKHKLRFPEDLPVGSDQPFTLEACVRAAKISVLADYTYYYAVKRGDASNITYRANHLSRLRCTERIMHFAASLIEAGPQRDAVLKRHFTWELAKLVQDDFPALDAVTRTEICAGIAKLADEYFTDALRDAMDVKRRVRICLARRGAVEELVRAIEDEAEHGSPPLLLEDGRAFVRYRGFRDPSLGLPDRAYEVIGEAVPGRLAENTSLVAAEWDQHGDDMAVDLTVRLGLAGETGSAVVRLATKAMPKSADKPGARRLPVGHELPATVGEFTRKPTEDGEGTLLTARIPVKAKSAKLGVRVYADVAGSTYEIPVPVRGRPLPLARRWRERVPYRISANANPKGRLVITTAPLWEPSLGVGKRLRQLMSRVKRKLTR